MKACAYQLARYFLDSCSNREDLKIISKKAGNTFRDMHLALVAAGSNRLAGEY